MVTLSDEYCLIGNGHERDVKRISVRRTDDYARNEIRHLADPLMSMLTIVAGKECDKERRRSKDT